MYTTSRAFVGYFWIETEDLRDIYNDTVKREVLEQWSE
jgi:hypothetical protein